MKESVFYVRWLKKLFFFCILYGNYIDKKLIDKKNISPSLVLDYSSFLDDEGHVTTRVARVFGGKKNYD